MPPSFWGIIWVKSSLKKWSLRDKDVKLYLSNDVDLKDIKVSYKGKNELTRNIKKDDKIGEYIIEYDGNILYREDALSPIDVKFKLKTIHKVILGIVIFLILLTVLKKKKRRRNKKYR